MSSSIPRYGSVAGRLKVCHLSSYLLFDLILEEKYGILGAMRVAVYEWLTQPSIYKIPVKKISSKQATVAVSTTHQPHLGCVTPSQRNEI
jgi:hypothetical protein